MDVMPVNDAAVMGTVHHVERFVSHSLLSCAFLLVMRLI